MPRIRSPGCSSDVHELAATVVALARIAFRVLVGQHAALGLEHARAGVVFRRDQLDVVLLATALVGDGLGKLGVEAGDLHVALEHGDSVKGIEGAWRICRKASRLAPLPQPVPSPIPWKTGGNCSPGGGLVHPAGSFGGADRG